MLEAAMTQYAQRHRTPPCTDPLTLSDWYSLFPDQPGCADTRHSWPAKFPDAGRAEVYLIFDSSMRLLYVGMTTCDLNRRLGDYFGYVAGRGSGCLVKANMLPPWKVRPCYVRTIPLLHPEEAPVLEAYLI